MIKLQMQYFYVLLFVIINLFFTACSMQIFSFMGIKDEVDEKLPVIKTFRALPDVTSVGFEWKIPEDISLIDGYIIYRKNKKGEFIKVSFIKNAHSTHYYENKLEPNTEYFYAISSVGKDSKVSAKSNILKVKTSFIDPVDFVYASKELAQKIKIFWSPSPNPMVKNYIIEKKDKNNKFVSIGYTTNRMLVEFFDEGIGNDTEHTYRIVSQSYDGAKSVPSKEVIGKTRSIPNMVTDITTTTNKHRAIWIEWKGSDNKDIIGYNVWVSNNNDIYTKLAFVQRESYIDKINEDGVIRYYKVSSVDKYKLESNLQENGIIGQTLAPPTSPTISQGLLEKNIAIIKWDKIDDSRVIGYIVYKQDGGYGKVSRFADIKDTQFIDKNIQDGISYIYYVVSVDKLGMESLPSKKIMLSLLVEEDKKNNKDSNKK